MLVTFETKAYANITMFGDVARALLELMGHSGSVPSAIAAADVPDSLSRLRAAVDALRAGEAELQEDADEEEREARVGLDRRAYPLIQLLDAAARQGCAVSWR